jgi:hypothetical protein
VYLIDAAVPPTDPSGSSWDLFGGLPDPYVIVSIPDTGQSARSATIDNTLSPVWDAAVLLGVTAQSLTSGSGISYAMFDEDIGSPDDPIGNCSGVVATSDLDGQPHQACSGQLSLRVRFLPH